MALSVGGAGCEAAPVLRLQIDGSALECEWFDAGGSDGAARDGAADRGGERDERSGGGAALVFLHEGLGSLTQWRGVPAQLCRESGRAGLAYARAGHGRSQRPVQRHGGDYMHHEARVVLPELLQRFAVRSPVLVGHSDGASIALIHAAEPAARLSGLVLLAPHVMVEDCTVAGIRGCGRRLSLHPTGRAAAASP